MGFPRFGKDRLRDRASGYAGFEIVLPEVDVDGVARAAAASPHSSRAENRTE